VTLEEELLALEQQFWTQPERVAFFSDHLAGDPVMVFPPPAGIFDEEAIIASLEDTPAWESARLDHATVVRLRDTAAVLAYRADAERRGRSYSCYAASVYVRQDDGDWRLAFHQQTPIS
jgi:hypothetical protein